LNFFGNGYQVQHPGAHELMMTDIRNQKMFAAFLQRFDVQFDILSILDELEHQVELEFDFVKEAVSMDQISKSLQSANQGKSPIAVPRSIPGLVTKYVLLLQICVFFFLLM
jgi:predicted unusual protein kinase regulating ubiquinone biosynthesis (AarF/ABC1/UbiB family)